MNRRRFLRTVGAGGMVGLNAGLAGCSQFSGGGSNEEDTGRAEACKPYEPTVTGQSGWRTVRGDPAGTGVVPASEAPEPPLSLDWTFTLGGMAGAIQPVATTDRVYAHEYDSMLYAVDAESGEEVWGRRVDRPRGSLAIADDVVVALADSTVLGLDPETGETRWTGPETHTETFHGSPVIVDETVYVPTELSLLALDLADGSVRWQHTTGEETIATPAIVGNTVYYGDHDTYVYAVDAATGEERWRVKTNAHIDCNVSVGDGVVFAGSKEGIIRALDAGSGEHIWTHDLGAEPNAIATDGSHVYAHTRGQLHALETSSGASCWSTAYGDTRGIGVAVGGGRVYVPLTEAGFTEPRSEYGTRPGVLDAATGETLAQTQGEFESDYARFYKGSAVTDGAVYASGVGEGGITLARFS
ncbi:MULTISPECIES: PQQ-binding-like beta-propeller repeat protein [Haloferax]|uniref:PQQ-binding-like beta-propeller repeat protein n=2 Tax=Haloferax TaxID=2251 RepID=A0A6G1Z774_9EURY|nr:MULTISPECIES: PQQ-binding-like beta-propeller repeat protein [Haloferax]KAB1185091.1 PQQ-binding-like beta-propeller repeat protein [Haloferax sp. CBA1149]MRW82268.1 PQQ-binding-like beta-propeller repeat protein [Haloferax marinisediminis]